jgi:hypothetical protein
LVYAVLMRRPDALDFEPACYCGAGQGYDATTGVCDSDSNKVSGWDNWWLDIHNATCLDNVKTVMQGRIDRAAAKGCEGIDADNVDSVSEMLKAPYLTVVCKHRHPACREHG